MTICRSLIGADAAIGKPGEMEDVVALFKRLLDRKGGNSEDEDENEDQAEV